MEEEEVSAGFSNLSVSHGKTPAASGDLSRYVQDDFAKLTRVETRDELGRVVIALQDFPVGARIVREDPVLVWETDDFEDCITLFESLPKNDQDGIMDMFHPSLDLPSMLPFRALAVRIGKSSDLDELSIQKFFAICNTNSKEYYGRPTEDYKEITTAARSGKSALFLYSSKVAHSCFPNVSYSSKTLDGKLEFKAIQPIRAGDMITFSYIEKVIETPTHLRRANLQATKEFICRCDRCMGPDYNRLVPCSTCKELVACTYNNETGSAEWVCQVCSSSPVTMSRSAVEEKEQVILSQIDQVERRIMVDVTNVTSGVTKELIQSASCSLSPLHFATLRAMEIHIRLCASHASNLGSQLAFAPTAVRKMFTSRFGTPNSLRRDAATTGLRLVRAGECIAAHCNGKNCSGSGVHLPVYQCSQIMFFACQDYMQAGYWEPSAVEHIRRYLPFMRILYGESDEDVAKIERSLPKTTEEERDTKKPAPTSITSSAQARRSKKGHKTNKKKKKGRK